MTRTLGGVRGALRQFLAEPSTRLPAVFFMGFKIIKYRIIRDNYAGFEVQKWRWYFPFWIQLNFVNTNISINQAIKLIENDMIVVVAK